MADPLTLITIGSAALGAVSSIQQGNAQGDALERNAQVDRINAGTSMATAEADVARQQEEGRRRLATATNIAAASGVDITSGSPIDVLSEIAASTALDEHITRWKGQQRTSAYLRQADTDEASADQARTAGLFGAGTTLLTSAGRYYANNPFSKSTTSSVGDSSGDLTPWTGSGRRPS